MDKNDGGPAMPVPSYVNRDGETFDVSNKGLSLRDYFAAKAMHGLLSNSVENERVQNEVAKLYSKAEAAEIFPKVFAGLGYKFADAMLEMREK